MATGRAKLRARNLQDFQAGEHVWVDASFFDDPKVPKELRFSATQDNKKTYGVIYSVSTTSCRILFDDDEISNIPKAKVNLVSDVPKEVVCNAIVEDDHTNVQDDPDWEPVEEAEDSDSDIPIETESLDGNDRAHFLMKDNKNMFLGKLIPGDIVHNKILQGSERKFLILSVIDAERWEDYDEDRHTAGTYIAWDLKETVVKVQERRPVASLESIIPAETLVGYQKHLEEGCTVSCSGLESCKFKDGKVYNEWASLRNGPPGSSPVKTNKRGRINKKEEQKRLKLEGKAYTTAKGKEKAARKPMQWVTCKCANKCTENLDIEDRKMLYEQYWNIQSDNERRQYILAHQESTQPAQTTTKGNSRRTQTVNYHLNKSNGDHVRVCPNVFHETLQVTRKFMRYAQEQAIQGFSKQDQRGKNTVPKHKLKEHQKNRVLAHIDSFPKVEGHYVRKRSKKIYIEDNTNFSKLTMSKMHQLYLAECNKEGIDDPIGLATYKNIFNGQNLKIHKPKKDQCKICTKYKRSNPEEKVELESAFRVHIENKEKVKNLKEDYKTKGKEDENLLVFNFDLEAVLYTPCDKVSTIFYLRKLCTYNSTAFDIVSKNGHCYIWDESEGNKGSDEIGTSIYRYLEGFKGKEVVMFSDTCGGQNRNQFMATLLLHIVRNHSSIQTLDYIFMVQGHSHMEVDSMHSAIERKSGGLQIYDPYGWAVVASIARRNPYFVHQLYHGDFLDLKQLKEDMKITNVNRDEKGQQVRWKEHNSITWMRFEKEKPNTILYKLTYNKDDEFKQIPVIKQTKQSLRGSVTADISSGYTLPRAYSKRLPISKAKLKDLRKLCEDKTIPSSHHQFYEQLESEDDKDDNSSCESDESCEDDE